MVTIKQTVTFRRWVSSLKDNRAVAAIAARVNRLANGLASDAKSIGDGVTELRVHYGPGYRVYCIGVETCWSFCCAVATSRRRPEISVGPLRWCAMRISTMKETLTIFDPAEYLTTDEGIAVFMADAFETGDAAYIAHAVGVVARAKGMTELARQTGLSREQLYRSLSEEGNPTLRTMLAVMKALGVELSARPIAHSEP